MNFTIKIFLSLGLIISLPASAQRYALTDLGVLGGNFSQAFGINDLGAVVGGSTYSSGNTETRGFLYSGGVMIDLNAGTGLTRKAVSINNSGTILLERASGVSDFLIKDGAQTNLPTAVSGLQYTDYSTTYANGVKVNNNDIVAGNTVVVGKYASISHATIFDGTTAAVVCCGSALVRAAYAVDINDSNIELINVQYGGPYGFDRTIPSLGIRSALIGNINGISYGIGINNKNQVIGLFNDLYSNASTQARIIDGDQIINLGADFTPSDLNDDGVAIGVLKSVNHAAVWMDGQLFDLNSLIDPSSGMTLLSASGINSSGMIVGNGMVNGEVHAYLLTPVAEPEIYALMLAGLAAVGAAARRKGSRAQ